MGIGLIELLLVTFLIGFLPFIFAFIDILKNEFTGNNKLIWVIVVLFVPLIGSIAYFFIGTKQKVKDKNIQ